MRATRDAHRDTQMVLDGVPVAKPSWAMAIECFGEADRVRLRRAGQVAAATLRAVGAQLQAGMTTADIDVLVREDTRRRGGQPSQLGYRGFPAAVCTSVNDVVCHGIPSPRVVLRDGDIINVDVTTFVDGFHGDTSRTFFIGQPGSDARKVVEVAERCLWAGIEVARAGARLGDVGAAIERLSTAEGCSVVRDFGGHGIGRVMHAEPHVAHFGTPGRGLRLRPGMAFTIEPMINLGGAEVVLERDEWTVRTADGSLSAQFEHTILIGERGPEVVTVDRVG